MSNLSLVPPSTTCWFGQINHSGRSLFTVYGVSRQAVVDRLRQWIKDQPPDDPGGGYLVIIRRDSVPQKQEATDGPEHT